MHTSDTVCNIVAMQQESPEAYVVSAGSQWKKNQNKATHLETIAHKS